LIGSSGLAGIIREGKTQQLTSFIQAGAAEGMQTMDATLLKLVIDKQVTAEAALEKALDKESFAKQPAIASQLKT
jgi:twitching motility protein PilT